MAEQKKKVSELPEQEQKELIAKAYAVGLKGVFTAWNVETLKAKIAEIENKNGNNDGEEQHNASTTENEGKSNSDNNPQEKEVVVAGDGGVFEIENETAENQEKNPPKDAEEITVQEAEKLQEKAKTDKLIPGEKVSQKKETKKSEGICHICRSKVKDGVCTGCGFRK